MTASQAPTIGLVVPTLGQRIAFLDQTLESIAAQQERVQVVVVFPQEAMRAREVVEKRGLSWVPDPGSLPGAINVGVDSLNPSVELVSWLGDDDLLTSGSLTVTSSALGRNPAAVLAYGGCQYINEHGQSLWVNRAPRLAEKVLSWGPQLIPQPGMLVRRSAWVAAGGLDESLRFAFDFDLLLKLRQLGSFVSVPEVVSAFRWHAQSLTVSDRSENLRESEIVKRRYLSPRQHSLKWVWERPVRVATKFAAAEVNRRARRHAHPEVQA